MLRIQYSFKRRFAKISQSQRIPLPASRCEIPYDLCFNVPISHLLWFWLVYVWLAIQFRRLALKSPPLGPKWGRWAKKLGCASDPPKPADCRLEDRMRTRVFSSTYPNWALVGGTSRPAGETVCGEMRNEIRDRIWCK